MRTPIAFDAMSTWKTDPSGTDPTWMHTVTGADTALFVELYATTPPT